MFNFVDTRAANIIDRLPLRIECFVLIRQAAAAADSNGKILLETLHADLEQVTSPKEYEFSQPAQFRVTSLLESRVLTFCCRSP